MQFEKTNCKQIIHQFKCSNNDEVSKWVEAIQCATFGIEKGTQLNPRRLYIIINPKSGNQTALKMFNTKVKPILQVSHVTFYIEVTKKPKEAIELVKKVDLSKYDELIACGGDGTLHEVVQGLDHYKLFLFNRTFSKERLEEGNKTSNRNYSMWNRKWSCYSSRCALTRTCCFYYCKR